MLSIPLRRTSYWERWVRRMSIEDESQRGQSRFPMHLRIIRVIHGYNVSVLFLLVFRDLMVEP